MCLKGRYMTIKDSFLYINGWQAWYRCADPGIFIRGGGGGSRSVWQKSSDNDFFSPQLILQKSNGQFQRNLSFFKAPDGVQFFSRGGGGVQLLIPYRNPFNLWFSRGGPDSLPPPLWIRTWCSPHSFMVKATIHYLIWAWQTLISEECIILLLLYTL